MTKLRLVDVHPKAAAEINDADDWYSVVDPSVARRLRDSISASLRRIGEHPLSYPYLEKPLRRCVVRGFPYVILFDDSRERILVIVVAHTRRRPGYWRSRIR